MLTAAVVQFLDGCYCFSVRNLIGYIFQQITCLLYTSDAADE